MSGGQNDLSELTVEQVQGGEEIISSAHPSFDGFFHFFQNGVRQEVELVVSGESVTTFGNALLFCASASFDCGLRSRMNEEFGAVAVFEVSDVNEFAKVLSAHQSLQGFRCQQQSIQYTDNYGLTLSVKESKPVDPFAKGPNFAWQLEYRIVWEGADISEPFNVEEARLKPLISRVA